MGMIRMMAIRSLFWIMLALHLYGCASLPRAVLDESTPDGTALLLASAKAHGWEHYRALHDINLRHEGKWFTLVARLQPVLVDSEYRVRAEERILVGARESAKSYSGGLGSKHTYRNPYEVAVYYDTKPEPDAEKRDAAALVLDSYRLFLLGPLFLKEQEALVQTAGVDKLNNQAVDLLLVKLRPGFGFASQDRVLAYIGHDDRLLKRVRFSIEGLASTKGAVIEVDYFDYIERDGVMFPTRWFERVKRPISISAREWHMTGLDLNRGYDSSSIRGPVFTGPAAAPAKVLHR